MIFALFYRSQVSPELQDTIPRVLSELRLFRGEVVKEKIVFHSEREREQQEKNEKNKEIDREHRAWFEKNNK